MEVAARDGVVILSGSLARPGLIPAAERLASGVDGVVAVINKLAVQAGTSATSPASALVPLFRFVTPASWALKSAGPVNVRPGRNERSR